LRWFLANWYEAVVILRSSEWVALLYFSSLTLTAFLLRVPVPIRRGVASIAATLSVVILVLATMNARAAGVLRDAMPLAYLPLGYWLPAHLVRDTSATLEQTLLAWDRRWFGRDGLTRFTARAPQWVIEALELAYLLCYPMVPIGFALILINRHAGSSIDRFWTAVLLAAFCCYGLLPWLPTRPPRSIERTPARASSVRALNLRVLGRASHQLNTFPSGHAAASVAVALAVGAHLPIAGAMLAVLAGGILAGSVIGRYHYAADAITGAIVALLSFSFSRF